MNLCSKEEKRSCDVIYEGKNRTVEENALYFEFYSFEGIMNDIVYEHRRISEEKELGLLKKEKKINYKKIIYYFAEEMYDIFNFDFTLLREYVGEETFYNSFFREAYFDAMRKKTCDLYAIDKKDDNNKYLLKFKKSV